MRSCTTCSWDPCHIYNVARVRRLFTKFQVNACKTKKDTSAHLIVEIQDMIYNVPRVMRLSTKFQVDTCKSKEDRSAHLVVEIQAIIYEQQGTGGSLQNFKSMHTKLKEIDLRMRSCAPCNWDLRHDLWCGKGQEVMYKISSQYIKK